MALPTLLRRGDGDLIQTSPLISDFLSDPFFLRDFPLVNLARRTPDVNIRETNNEFIVEVASPGMNKDDFKVTLENNNLTIEVDKEENMDEKNEKYARKEYNYTSFCRSFSLPDTVKSDSVKAQYDNGILKLSIPKTDEAKKNRSVKEIKIS